MVLVVRMLVSVRMPVPMAIRNRLRGGEHEPACLDALRADQSVGEFSHSLGATAEQNDLEAAMSVEVHVCRRDDVVELKMLEFGQPLGDASGVVIVDECQDPHRWLFGMSHGLLD
jgi:hypothetical protein